MKSLGIEMKMDEKQYFEELNKHINKILISSTPKKLIVARPGTGKTNFFKKAINHYALWGRFSRRLLYQSKNDLFYL